MSRDADADAIIAALGLEPHPEGGLYRETWRSPPSADGERGLGTAIYFMLRAHERSRWHRVDVTEIWHHYAGAPLELLLATGDTSPPTRHTLGADLGQGQQPQIVIPPRVWQQARSLGTWTLVGCTCTPAFTFEGFEMAPDGWEPR